MSSHTQLIRVCVRLKNDADIPAIQRAIAGRFGKCTSTCAPSHRQFWASTAMTLKQVQAIDGVQSCTLSPAN